MAYRHDVLTCVFGTILVMKVVIAVKPSWVVSCIIAGSWLPESFSLNIDEADYLREF